MPIITPITDPYAVFTDGTVGVRYKSFGNTGSREIYIGKDDLGIAANRVETDYVWVFPGQYQVVFTNDPVLTGDLAGLTLSTTVTPTNGTLGLAKTVTNRVESLPDVINAFKITHADRHTTGQVDFTDVIVNEQMLTDNFIGNIGGPIVGPAPGYKYSTDLFAVKVFTISGKLTLSGYFPASGDELSKVELKVGYIYPPPPASPINVAHTAVRFRSFGNTGGSEVYIGVPDLAVAANRSEQNFVWENGDYKVNVIYNPWTGVLSVSGFNINNTTNAFGFARNVGLLGPINSFKFILASRDAAGQVDFTEIQTGSSSPADMIGGRRVDVQTGELSPFSGVYTVTGKLHRSGTFSGQENSKLEIQFGSDLS
jgi:hypothetical protein